MAAGNPDFDHPLRAPLCAGSEEMRSPQAQARAGSEGRVELQLSGDLCDDWGLRLTRGLAAHRVGLHSGYARRLEPGCWIAKLELDLACGGSWDHDFLSLATHFSALPDLRDPRILDFELRESGFLGGSLELRVDAWDSIGLLAAVLGRAALAGLHPHEIILETEGECAFHQLTLKARDGVRPGRREGWLLSRGLERLLDR